jgi:hypothetical protein
MYSFPTEWDTLMYHRPLVDQWLRSGSLYAPAEKVWYNPGACETVGLWLGAPFSGDFLLGASNVAIVTIFAAAAFLVCREFGLNCRLSHVVALILMTNPVILSQATDSKNDAAVAGLALAAIAFGSRYVRFGRLYDAVGVGMALGILTGVKYYAVGSAAVTLLVLMGMAAATVGARRTASIVACAAGGAGALSGYWYLRNAIVTGTPVYPKGFAGSRDVIGEVAPHLWTTTLALNGRAEIPALFVDAVWKWGGPAFVASLLMLPMSLGVLCGASLAYGTSGFVRNAATRCGLAAFVVGNLLLLAFTPFGAETAPGTLIWCVIYTSPRASGCCSFRRRYSLSPSSSLMPELRSRDWERQLSRYESPSSRLQAGRWRGKSIT